MRVKARMAIRHARRIRGVLMMEKARRRPGVQACTARINDGKGASLHKARNLADLSKRLEGCYCNTDDTRARPSLEIQTKY